MANLNVKGIFKAIIAGGTAIGAAILGNEARKCFTKPCADADDIFDDADMIPEADVTEDPAEEAAEEDETAEVPED